LLQKVPVHRIADFESEFLLNMREQHADTLQQLKEGKVDGEITKVLDAVCAEVAKKYEA
ncbi:MAG: F0F1 ATP synthase subunit alpha, partial [Bacteroidales bacterium]|nr:F0F1 ATP synthase subunit alpha [Bacteroidales bacterium]